MNEGKSILVDTSRCTACRGCQIACKQWNQLPGTQTKQSGSYQNPPDFSHDTYKVVRFSEGVDEKSRKPYWYFFSDMCRHCVQPPCQVASNNNEIRIDEEVGAVIYTAATAGKDFDFDMAKDACPYDVPRRHPQNGVAVKCTLCLDRVRNGLKPACVLSCPTGAMRIGERQEILSAAKKRVDDLKKSHPMAKALNADSVRVIYIVTDDPKKYHKFAEE